MSWLLVALIPALLMLAALGLERLETGLDDDTVTAADVAEFLHQAQAPDGTSPAQPHRHRAGSDAATYAFTCESAVSRN